MDTNSTGGLQITDNDTADKLQKKFQDIHDENFEEIAESRAASLGAPYVNLDGFPIATDAIAVIPEEQAEALKIVCFLYTGSEIRFGAINPANPQVLALINSLKEKLHAESEIYLISEKSFEIAFKIYEKIPKIREIIRGVKITADDINKFSEKISSLNELQSALDNISVTDIITFIIAGGLKTNSSDIHIEAEEKDIKVRFRVDGILHTVASLKPEGWEKLISRIKLLAELKININDKPQDGRFTIFLPEDKIEVRVSTIPTSYGESVVLRLLRSSATGLNFEDLGIRGKSFVDIAHEIKRPNGMIIATGPTGSGKTTTLYAILNKLNDSETKIISLEDPIEYKLDGINQSQIDYSKDYTFAKGLRSILRQDPDIVMVGEIRDLETAEIAVNAALTGHLVISTIHTNSAAGAIPRFMAMGVKPFLLSPALNAIIGQRLVRKLCPECKTEQAIDNDTMTKILNILSTIPAESASRLTQEELTNLKFYHSKGCPACHGLGFKGRIGIYEILIMSPEIEKIILSGKVSEHDIEEVAVSEGMLTMAQDGLLKAKDGITTVEEVFKVVE